MMDLWIAAILLIGQILVAITLLSITRTFGIYAEKLLATHQQNIKLRQNLATMGNEIALSELLRKNPPPGKEKVS